MSGDEAEKAEGSAQPRGRGEPEPHEARGDAATPEPADEAKSGRERRRRPPRPLPPWVAPALVALVCWATGAHQCGPISVYAASRPLPFLACLIEEVVAVAVTVAALAAGVALAGGRRLSLRLAYRTACEARYPIALAAALASRASARTFLPDTPLAWYGGPGQKPTFLQWIWLIVMGLAVAGLLMQACLKYLHLLTLVLPGGLRPALALAVAFVVGEVTGAMISGAITGALFPPLHGG